ncbi:MAG: hypothetical protein AAGK02_10060 [Pseudomonadota bacterium]
MLTGTVLSIVILAAILLLVGAYVLWRRTGSLKQPLLMVLLAAIALGNVLIWTVPTPSGDSPIERLESAGNTTPPAD